MKELAQTTKHAVENTKHAVEKVETAAHDIKHWDEQRPDFPGEHLVVAVAGLALLMASGKARTPLKKMILTAVGTAALARAASGRGGVARVAGWVVGKK